MKFETVGAVNEQFQYQEGFGSAKKTLKKLYFFSAFYGQRLVAEA